MLENRVGKTETMKSGQKATIVKYNDANNIDVLLEEGIVVCGKRYSDFANGDLRVMSGDKTYVPSEDISRARQMADRTYLGTINMFI